MKAENVLSLKEINDNAIDTSDMISKEIVFVYGLQW